MRVKLIVAVSAFLLATSSTLAQVPNLFYTTHGNGTRLGIIEKNSGVGVDVGAFGTSQTWAGAFDNIDGTYYTTYNGFFSSPVLAKVDLGTGAITPIGSIGTPMIALEVGPDGYLYGVSYFSGILYRISKTTGARSFVGFTGISFTMDLAFDSGGQLWATVGNNFYTINTSNGASTYQFTATGVVGGSLMGISFDKQDNLYATAYVVSSPFYAVNLQTGVASVVGATGMFAPHGGDIFIRQGAEVFQGGNCFAPGVNANGDLAPSLGGSGTNTKVLVNANKITLTCHLDVQNLSGKAAVFRNLNLFCQINVSGTIYLTSDFHYSVSESGKATLKCTYER